jgi:hypothetical protein
VPAATEAEELGAGGSAVHRLLGPLAIHVHDRVTAQDKGAGADLVGDATCFQLGQDHGCVLGLHTLRPKPVAHADLVDRGLELGERDPSGAQEPRPGGAARGQDNGWC